MSGARDEQRSVLNVLLRLTRLSVRMILGRALLLIGSEAWERDAVNPPPLSLSYVREYLQ